MNEVIKTSDMLSDFQNTQQLCALLMKSPHYQKLGAEGIFAIIETAKSLGVDPKQALGGGLYYVRGKVEMSSRMMNSLIRAKKHSITRDRKSDDTICILHGKRADNGDTWTESFSLEDAKRAGLDKNPVWKSFTKDMLFARASSRLARQLYPDVIGNVYVEGEISLDQNILSQNDRTVDFISSQECEELEELIGDDEPYRQSVLKFLANMYSIHSMDQMPRDVYEKIKIRATKNKKDRDEKQGIYALELQETA